MKSIIILLMLGWVGNALASTPAHLDNNKLSKIADAIFRIEGGNNTKYPYGIKSVKTSHPRQICINTIRNNYSRWVGAGAHGDFLNFLADVYCPSSDDRIGNRNWKKNIHKLVDIR